MYPPEEQAVFEAAWRVLDNAMLVSECSDFVGVLKEHGFELVKTEDLNSIKTENESLKNAVFLIKGGIRESIKCHWLKRPEYFGIHHCSACTFGLICPDSLVKNEVNK